MKKLFFFFILIVNCSLAQTWSVVGSPDFADVLAQDIFSAVAPNGEPYVIYRDYSMTTNGIVKKFNGSDWVTVGGRFSNNNVTCTTMAFDTAGTPFIAFTDWGNGYKATVMKFNGTNWDTIGIAGFTPGPASFTSITIDQNGTPYIAFRDSYYNYRASVMKFNGTNWEYVGTPGFSSNTNFGGAAYTLIKIDKNGSLYVSYTDDSNNFKATVMRFDGNNWIYVGTPGFSQGQTNNPSMVIDSNGAPIVAYRDGASGGKATVMKFDGNNWIPLDIPGFSPGAVSYTFLAIDNNDVLYLIFKDYANAQKATVMTFDGTNWTVVGTPGFSITDANYTSISIDKNNGTLYAAYENVYDASTSHPTYDATVMKFNISSGIKDASTPFHMTVYPNPTSRLITININPRKVQGKLSLKVNNTLGKTVYSENLKENSEPFTKQIDLGTLPKGIYFIELQLTSHNVSQNATRQVTKFILQ
jgi:hypothetical protein